METKELKIQVPEGYEIDNEKSTLEYIKFKPIKKDITYNDVGNRLFNNNKKCYYYIDACGDVQWNQTTNIEDANNATNEKQLKRILALNQLLNIAEYYNNIHNSNNETHFYIVFYPHTQYSIYQNKYVCVRDGIIPLFNRKEDAQAVIDNPNFREILDTIYKL